MPGVAADVVAADVVAAEVRRRKNLEFADLRLLTSAATVCRTSVPGMKTAD
jgi:hypothetical protein